MKVLSANVIAFAVGLPLAAGLVSAVVITRPDDRDNGAVLAHAATPTATIAPTRTPTPQPVTPTRAAATVAPTRAAPVATAAPEILRPLTGVRFGVIDVASNQTGFELPFPAEFAMSGYFVLEPGGSRVRYGLDSVPFMPALTGEAAIGTEWGDRGGHGVATGSGKFMGVATDWTIDFVVSEGSLSANVSIGRSGNLPGGKPVELTIFVAEAWQAAP